MKRFLLSAALVIFAAFSVQAGSGASVALKLSGEGAVNDSTIKAGTPVAIDVYMTNDTARQAFTLGFKFVSKSIKTLIHPAADSAAPNRIETNKRGDVRGFEGWQDKSIWDFGGVYVVEKDWDGVMPELLGFGGIAVKQGLQPIAKPTRILSINLVVPDTGRFVVDSAFYPPGGAWLITPPSVAPKWSGPYSFKVVK